MEIVVSGGLDPKRINGLIQEGSPADVFAVGSCISAAHPIDSSADLHEVDGRPIAKRGRTPSVTPNPRLNRVM